MNCRRINSLLSAYLDGELTGREMSDVRAHLDGCHSCQNEHETLRATKRMVASLALKVPREELESLLIAQGRQHEAARTESPYYLRMAAWLLGTHPITLQSDISGMKTALPLLRPRPLAATALLSLAGFWAASASLDSSAFRDGAVAASGNSWYMPSVTYGSEVTVRSLASGPAYIGNNFAASSNFRPSAALAAWLTPRSSDAAANSEAAVSLPLAASNNAPSAWGARTQNASFPSGSPSAFLPSGSASGAVLMPASLGTIGH